MVSVKKLLIATSLLLSEAAASPFPASKQSVAAAEARTANDFAIEARDLNDVSVADIEAPSKDKRVVVPLKPVTGPKVPVHPEVPPVEAPPAGTRPDGEGPAPGTKPDGESSPGTKPDENAPPPRLGQEPEKPMCKLSKRGDLYQGSDVNAIQEDQYMMAGRVRNDPATVTELSGCTALFFYDSKFRPSVFHVMCGEEKQRGNEAAQKVKNARLDTDNKGVRVMASDATRYNNAVEGIKEVLPNIEVVNPVTDLYDDTPTKGTTTRVKITSTPGSTDVTKGTHVGVCVQPSRS